MDYGLIGMNMDKGKAKGYETCGIEVEKLDGDYVQIWKNNF